MLKLINSYIQNYPELDNVLTKESATPQNLASWFRLLADKIATSTSDTKLPISIFHNELVVHILNSTPDAVVVINPKGEIVFASKQAEGLFEYSSSDIVGRQLDILLPDRYRNLHHKHLKHYFSKPTTRPMAAAKRELYGLRSNGNEFPIDISLNFIQTEDGVFAISNIRDISERKKAEAITARNQRLLEESQKITQLGSWELDITNNKLTWSDEVYRIFEIDKDQFEASYEGFLDVVHPDDKDAVNKAYTDSLKNKQPYNIVHRLGFKDGRIKYVREICKTFYNDTGEPIRSIGTVHDITEVRKTTIELNKRLNDMMQFNYIVSHNLRSPVASILGLAELLTAPGTTTSEATDITKHILSAAQRLDETIKDINTVLDTRTPLSEQKVLLSINEVLHRIFDSLHIQKDNDKCFIDDSKCKIDINITDDANDIYTIKSYFESILQNLLSNAIKYRSNKRKLLLSISANREENALRLTISDNGIGIDLDKYRDEVFSLYKRFNDKIEGKGLGLYMTKTQVEILGGHIDIESTPDVGTTFIMVFNKIFPS